MTDNTLSYDPNIIIRAADDKLAANDVAGGQTLFQSALLNWVDDARENLGRDPDQMKEAIATLWISYAHFLRKAKQFKSATEAYEQAVECQVSGMVGRIWLDYARFFEERDKLRSAQQVYLRALHSNGGAVRDEQDRSLLWNEFLEMMRQNNPNLTLAELHQAIQDETAIPETVASADSPAPKRPRLDSGSSTGIVKREDRTEEESPRTHVVTAADVDAEKVALQELTQSAQNDPQFMATWMVRDGDAPPQPPNPPLFSAAPPKLSDPTGKDLLGEKLALELVEKLLEPSGTVILQVCRGLWMLTALKEHQSQQALERIDATVKEEWPKLSARLDERLSVAGAAEAAVRQMNESEKLSFQANCNQQRQHVLSGIAWDFRQLLWVQQQFLTKLQIPGFQGTTVDASELEFQARVCSYLHSAFFLRQRIGEVAYVNMLKSQQERLKQMVDQNPQPSLSPGRRTPPPQGRRTPPPQSMPQYQQPYIGGPPPPPPPGYGFAHGQPQPQPPMMMPPPRYPQQAPPSYYQQ